MKRNLSLFLATLTLSTLVQVVFLPMHMNQIL